MSGKGAPNRENTRPGGKPRWTGLLVTLAIMEHMNAVHTDYKDRVVFLVADMGELSDRRPQKRP
ncbi:MAG: hypothetical protein WED00_08265 [Aquisalimonadaceae bacterium]